MAFEGIKEMKFPDGFSQEEKEMMYAVKYDMGLSALNDDTKINVLMQIVRELKNGNALLNKQ